MALRFLLDEQIRGPIWKAIQQHNAAGGPFLDTTRVGDPLDLPLGTSDSDILIWAEREQRIVLTLDRNTMPHCLKQHLAAGQRSAGIIVLDPTTTMNALLGALELVAYAGDAADFKNQVNYLP
jgi:hypothetical protein